MTRSVTFIVLLVAMVHADTVVATSGTFKGIVTMPDSSTISVALPLGGIQVLPGTSVRTVMFGDTARYRMFEIPLRKMGIRVDGPSAGISSAPFQDEPRVPVSVMERKPQGSGVPDKSVLIATYQSEKRDPAMAGLLSAFVPALGHVYTGETGTGAGFVVGEAALVVAAVLSGNAAATDTSSNGVFFSVISTVCWTGAVVTKICECGDAVNAASRYNRQLQDRLGLQLGLRHLPNESVFGVACRF